VKIIWRKGAQDDLNCVFDYVLQADPQAAVRLFETIRSKIERLAEFPGLGRPGRVENTRELVIAGTPYLVAYTVDPRLGAVIVLRVLHGRQVWPEAFDESV
jgi:toxin ParE1/3/4